MPASLLDRTFTADQVIAWGATLYEDESRIRRAFGPHEKVTIERALSSAAGAGRILWIIMREELLPARAIEHSAVALCRWLADRGRAAGAYIDFRSLQAIEAKVRWLKSESSEGEFRAAWRRAEDALTLVAELEDPVTTLVAGAVCRLCRERPPTVVTGIYYMAYAQFPADDDVRQMVDAVAGALRAWEER
jgi:hypothetical protein